MLVEDTEELAKKKKNYSIIYINLLIPVLICWNRFYYNTTTLYVSVSTVKVLTLTDEMAVYSTFVFLHVMLVSRMILNDYAQRYTLLCSLYKGPMNAK